MYQVTISGLNWCSDVTSVFYIRDCMQPMWFVTRNAVFLIYYLPDSLLSTLVWVHLTYFSPDPPPYPLTFFLSVTGVTLSILNCYALVNTDTILHSVCVCKQTYSDWLWPSGDLTDGAANIANKNYTTCRRSYHWKPQSRSCNYDYLYNFHLFPHFTHDPWVYIS